MDLTLNKLISFEALTVFLRKEFSQHDFFLLYSGRNSWEDVPDNRQIFQFRILEDMAGEYKYGVSIFMPADDLLPFLENLAVMLSNNFECRVVCDASRVVLESPATYFSLLFEKDTVYLVDDRFFEETGTFTKVAALNYMLPPLPIP